MLVSVCGAVPKVVARVAAETGAVPFTDLADLLRAGGIGLVLVLTPCAAHRQIVAQAAAAGIDVFCEKTSCADSRGWRSDGCPLQGRRC